MDMIELDRQALRQMFTPATDEQEEAEDNNDEDEPLFEVTFKLTSLGYGGEVSGATLDEVFAAAEEAYEGIDVTAFEVDGHTISLKPLNEAAHRLLDAERTQKKKAWD